MPRNVALRSSAVAACSLAILLCGAVVARAQVVDPSYDPGANQTVNVLAVQPNGKMIVGGGFTGLGGGTGTTVRNHIGRLNVDGTVDPTFNPGTNGPVLAVAVQADGKILAGGNFSAAGGGNGLQAVRQHIARFNADGTLDTAFNPGVSAVSTFNVWALAVQPDGKILVGGEFTTLAGTPRNAIGRLNADGSIDTAFNPGVTKLTGNPIVYTLLVQPDGKIVVGGYFNGLGGAIRNYLGRVDTNGVVDSFDPNVGSISGVQALALQADGKILVGGTFTTIGAFNRANIARLNVDGSVDSGFNPGAETLVATLGVQTDGKILVGGSFKWLGNAGITPGRSDRNYIGRLNPDGIVDPTFNPSANLPVDAVAIQGDGGIVLGGHFSRLNSSPNATTGGILRNGLARITNTAAVQTLSISDDGTVETWLRSGSGPEVSRVTFEFSFDGSFYSFIGNGSRIADGWRGTSVNLPVHFRTVYVRARGYYETGQNGSGSIVESIIVIGAASVPTPNFVNLNGDPSGGDVFLYNKATGARRFELTKVDTGVVNGFTEILNAWDPGWQVYPVKLNADAFTDFFLYDPVRGFWIQALNHAGDGTFTYTLGNWDSSWTVVPADLDGDGLTDLFVYNFTTGVWVKCFVDGSGGFKGYSAANWDPGWTFYTADLNGDGRDDFFLYNRVNGVWVEAFSQAGFGGFDYPATGQWDPGWQVTPADLNGDGKLDLFLLNAAGVHVSALSVVSGGFNYVSGAPWATGWTVSAADLNNDGRTDLFLYNPANGVWAEAFSNGAGDFTFATGVWDPGWTVAVTDFNGDGSGDILLSRADGIWIQAVNIGPGTFSYVAGNWGTGWTVFTKLGNR